VGLVGSVGWVGVGTETEGTHRLCVDSLWAGTVCKGGTGRGWKAGFQEAGDLSCR